MSVNIYNKATDTIQQIAGNAFDSGTGGGNADTLDGKHASDFALKTDIPTTLPANGGNADTLENLPANKFAQNLGTWSSGDIKDLILAATNSGFVAITKTVTGMPTDGVFWYGFLDCNTVNRCLRVTSTGTTGLTYSISCLPSTSPVTWYDWHNVADGGNASTVGGKSISQLMSYGMAYGDRTQITSGDLDNYHTAGRFIVKDGATAAGITNSAFATAGYFLDVFYRTATLTIQIAYTWSAIIKIRYSYVEDTVTKWSSWKNIADDGNADTARKALGGYTYVVDSNDALLAWANNESGNNYTHVLVKSGTWTLSEKVAGINLTQSGTKTVTGEAGNKIIVEYGLNYDFATLGDLTVYGLYYESVPDGDDYFVDGINIDVSQTSSVTTPATVTSIKHFVQGFVNIKNLKNSIVTVYNKFPVGGNNFMYGCVGCSNIDNVAVNIKIPPSSSPSAFAYGLFRCRYLNNCLVKQITTDGSSVTHGNNTIYGCANCEYILNSNIEVIGSNAVYGITNSNYITNTRVKAMNPTSAGGAIAISSSSYICDCNIFSSSVSASTIASSKYISNCHVAATAGVGGALVKSCNNITNTKVEFNDAGTTGVSQCTKVYGCHVAIPLSNNNTAYSNSFADSAGTAAYACADTPNGGWNTTEDTSTT